MTKVTLPKDVAEAIEALRRLGKDNRWIIDSANGLTSGDNSLKIRKFAHEDVGNFDKMLSALVNGFEIEKSPEDNLREYYDWLGGQYASFGSTIYHHIDFERRGIRKTLDILDIQIEGINE